MPWRRLGIAGCGALLALVPALLLWGFTVDDALIPGRYATHLARGQGYRFNVHGPVSDGVTALGWAHMLSLFASGGPLVALRAAKWIGLVGWVLSAASIAHVVSGVSERPLRFASLAIVALSAPLAAWSVAGLETGFVMTLASLAVVARSLGREGLGSIAAGFAAALRPELLPWAGVVAASPAAEPGNPSTFRRWWMRLALALAPAIAVAIVRALVFGRAAPLSILAKRPDFTLGTQYAVACFLLTGPMALVAPFAWRKLGGWPRGLIVAVFVHFGAIAVAGGDWMPLSRLAAPVLPTVAIAIAHVVSVGRWPLHVARLALVALGEVFAWTRAGPAASRVMSERGRVMEELRPALEPARVVATLDVGWVGAITDATIVDLAGVTDPRIAALPGGHTTKEIPVLLLDTRNVDTLVLLIHEGSELREPWTETRFERGVELRIARIPQIGEEFELVRVSSRDVAPGSAAGPARALRYAVLRRTAQQMAVAERLAGREGR